MLKSERAKFIQQRLNELYPNPPIPLEHQSSFQLLVAVLLSAQCTDKRVNEVTPNLFAIASNWPRPTRKTATEYPGGHGGSVSSPFIDRKTKTRTPGRRLAGFPLSGRLAYNETGLTLVSDCSSTCDRPVSSPYRARAGGA